MPRIVRKVVRSLPERFHAKVIAIEDSKMKSYITRQLKKFMKNANVKGFEKNRKQSRSSKFKSKDKGKKDSKDDGQ